MNLTGIDYGPISLPINTGYSGSILVPSAVYEIFKVGELPPKYWRVYSTMTGKLPMKTARGYVSINGIRLATLIETPAYGYGKFLIGREILNKLITILDGNRGLCCLAESIEKTNI